MLRVSGGISDEGFSGSRVRDTEDKNRFTKEGADFLVDAIKKATKPIENISQSNKAAISGVAGKIFENLAKNTEQVQAIVESQGDDTINEFNKLVKMMAAAQTKTGEASVSAIKELIKQIENIKIAAGDRAKELSDSLGGLDTAQKTLSDQGTVRRETFGDALFKKATGVDKRTESPWKAFSMEKMFGLDPGTGNILEQAKQEATDKRAIDEQVDGRAAAVAALVPASETKSDKENRRDRLKASFADTPPVKSVIRNAEGGDIAGGIDRESPQNRQVELLEQILAQLKEVEEGGGSQPEVELAKTLGLASVTAAITTAATAILPKLLLAGALIAPLKDLFDSITGSDGGANAENVGGVAGAVIGGAIGSIFGPLGTALGISIGNVVGGKLGEILDDAWESRERGPERTLRGPGGRERTTDAPLSFQETKDLEKYGTFDKVEIQRIQMERAGTATVVANEPLVALTTEQQEKAQIENPAFIQAIKDMPAEAREAFLDANPHMTPLVEAAEKTREAGEYSIMDGVVPDPTSLPDVTPNALPTADAVGNMTEASASQASQQAPTVINNVTNNNTQASNSAPPVLINPTTARNSVNSFIDFQSRQYTRV